MAQTMKSSKESKQNADEAVNIQNRKLLLGERVLAGITPHMKVGTQRRRINKRVLLGQRIGGGSTRGSLADTRCFD